MLKHKQIVFLLLMGLFIHTASYSAELYIRNRLVPVHIRQENNIFYAKAAELALVLKGGPRCNADKSVYLESVLLPFKGVFQNGECWLPLDKVAAAIGARFFVNKETGILDIAFPWKGKPKEGDASSNDDASRDRAGEKSPPAKQLYSEVRKFLASQLELTLEPLPYLEIVTEGELSAQHNSTSTQIKTDILGFYRPFNPEKIYIREGLSILQTGSVMAHELAHAWASRNLPSLPQILEEGFARWVEFKFYQALGRGEEMLRLLEDPTPDYGGGLRLLHQLELRHGRKQLIELLKSGKVKVQ